MGETGPSCVSGSAVVTFSILKRIGVGETATTQKPAYDNATFSILKRIGVGETKEKYLEDQSPKTFQYPQTDRSG